MPADTHPVLQEEAEEEQFPADDQMALRTFQEMPCRLGAICAELAKDDMPRGRPLEQRIRNLIHYFWRPERSADSAIELIFYKINTKGLKGKTINELISSLSNREKKENL
jgi:hypothetical protein